MLITYEGNKGAYWTTDGETMLQHLEGHESVEIGTTVYELMDAILKREYKLIIEL